MDILLQKPWRWGVALLLAAVILAVLNAALSLASVKDFFGLGTAGRLAVLVAIAALGVIVLPSPEEVDRGEQPRISFRRQQRSH